jgi:hypothetical protein
MSIDANTSGPPTAFASGAPYSTKFLQGTKVCSNADIALSGLPRISMWECEEMLFIGISCTTGWATYVGGKMIVRGTDAAELWANCPCGGIMVQNLTQSALQTQNTAFVIPTYSEGSSDARPCYWTGSAVRQFGRINAPALMNNPGSTLSLGVTGGPMILAPITLVDSVQTPTGQTELPLGHARQMRIGPECANRQEMVDPTTVRAYGVMANGISSGIGFWLDQQVAATAATTY